MNFWQWFSRWLWFEGSLQAEWDMHWGAHCFWRDRVYADFNVSSIREVLNLEPPIDAVDEYHAAIPDHFGSGLSLYFIEDYYDQMPPSMQAQAKQVLLESASIVAADAMCHPRDRVGKFDWSDVERLHSTLRYLGFYRVLQKLNLLQAPRQEL